MSNFKLNQFSIFLTTHKYTQKASHRFNRFNKIFNSTDISFIKKCFKIFNILADIFVESVESVKSV